VADSNSKIDTLVEELEVDRKFWTFMDNKNKGLEGCTHTLSSIESSLNTLNEKIDWSEDGCLKPDGRIDILMEQFEQQSVLYTDQYRALTDQISQLQDEIKHISSRLPPPLVRITPDLQQRKAEMMSVAQQAQQLRSIPGSNAYSNVVIEGPKSPGVNTDINRENMDTYKNSLDLSEISDDNISQYTLNNGITIKVKRSSHLDDRKSGGKSGGNNVLILSDSQLNKFDPVKFSTIFNCVKIPAGKIADLSDNDLLRRIRSLPNLCAIVIQLGINDLRNKSAEQAIGSLSNALKSIRKYISIPILVCKLTPVIREPRLHMEVRRFNDLLTSLGDDTSRESSPSRVISNVIFWRLLDEGNLSALYSEDDYRGLHLNDRGVALLSSNIKFGIANQLGIEIKRRNNNGRS
jgi:hypothetical protein